MSYEEEDDGQIPEPTPKTGGSNAGTNIKLFSRLDFCELFFF